MGQKISDLSALAGESVATGDLLPIVDVSATTSGSKKITLAEFCEIFPVVITTEMTGSAAVGTDELPFFDGGVPKTITVTELTTAIALLGFTLADIPAYADQAAAATALTGTGRLFRFDTTGALGVTIT